MLGMQTYRWLLSFLSLDIVLSSDSVKKIQLGKFKRAD